MANEEMEVQLDQEDDIITLVNDEGAEEEFYHIATIDYKNEWFIFLHPVEEMEDIAEDEAIIFKIVADSEGNDSFVPLDDEKLIEEVYAEYIKELDKLESEGVVVED